MGSAMLAGWLENGLATRSVWVIDPTPSDWLRSLDGLNLNVDLPKSPAIVLIAVKPQIMANALPVLAPLGNSDTLFLSVAAGISINSYAEMLGSETPIIRAMPNLPAAIGQGITALIGNAKADESQMLQAENLLQAVGQTVRLDNENQLDAVTGVSGSGPGYIFYAVEALAAAGVAQGLPAQMAMKLAKATVAGAGAMALSPDAEPSQLRQSVTSPGGTTKAGLEVLMNPENGLGKLMDASVAAAANRSRELAK